MKFKRVFTKKDKNVYEQFQWKAGSSQIKAEDGSVHFENASVEVPEAWDQVSIDTLCKKYLKRARVPSETIKVSEDSIPERYLRSVPAEGAEFGAETSLKQCVHRMVGVWTYWLIKSGLVDDEEQANIFYDELAFMIMNQMWAPNSPQWFNTGLGWAYGIEHSDEGYFYFDHESGEIKSANENPEDSICRQQAHACYILGIKDSMFGDHSIYDQLNSEAKIFKLGSGAGTNFSPLRGKGEPLSGGGSSSGVMSFLNIFDRSADSVKSGGTCLPGYQHVYTEKGPIPVEELVDNQDGFIVISYDPPAKRYKAKRASAWLAGEKEVVRVTTDKGSFDMSFDHTVRLSNAKAVKAGELKPGTSLFSCHMNNRGDHLRIERKDGFSGKEDWHRMIMRDILNHDIDGKSVHHKDGNVVNNSLDNLEPMSQSEHAKIHGLGLSQNNEHFFQHNKFPKVGEANGMHNKSPFWMDSEKVKSYKEKQSEILFEAGRAAEMQKEAAKQKMLNTAYMIINNGYPIDDFRSYVLGRKKTIGRIASISQLGKKIDNQFGSYDNFVAEVNSNNHRVISVETIGVMPVYDIEVDCPTPDDKSPQSGHNFVIWPDNSPVGSGIAVFNSRRAAKMVSLDIDHPEIRDFINWKLREEQKVASLVSGSQTNSLLLNAIMGTWVELGDEASYEHESIKPLIVAAVQHNVEPNYIDRAIKLAEQGHSSMPFVRLNNDFNGEAYHTVSGQNSNNSIGISDDFMDAVRHGRKWKLINRKDGSVADELEALELWNEINYAAWSSADPGIHFHGSMNAWHTCAADGRIHATNPCFTAETRIATPNGLVKIKDLVIKSVNTGKMIPVFTKDGEISTPSAYMVTGQNPIWEVELSDGRIIRCTENHNWYIDGVKIQTKNLENGMVVDLLSGSSLNYEGDPSLPADNTLKKYVGKGCRKDINSNIPSEWTEDLAEIIGYFVGDGSYCQSKRYHSTTWIFGTNQEDNGPLADRYKGILSDLLGGYKVQDNFTSSNCRVLRITRKPFMDFLIDLGCKKSKANKKRVPESIFKAPLNIISAYLKGYFTADGTVYGKEEEGSVSVSVASTSNKMLQDVQMLLDLMGIRSRISLMREGEENYIDGKYDTNDCYRLTIDTRDVEIFRDKISFALKYKSERLNNLLSHRNHIKARSKDKLTTIVGVKNTGEIETTYNLTEPINNLVFANGVLIAQCSEYVFLDNTACNLASIKLTKFYSDGTFDTDTFLHAVRLITVVLEMSVSAALLPTRSMAAGTRDYRTLGLGFADAGALAMQMCLPYGSEGARAFIGGVTALMTGQAYKVSAEMAKEIGPFARYDANKESMLRVIRNHRFAAYDAPNDEYEDLKIKPMGLNIDECPEYLLQAVRQTWDQALDSGTKWGFRNAQVTVIAPTGTIGLVMSCDTTGIEPDFALVKMKRLAGGGYLVIVNQSVPKALSSLGYTDEQVEAVIQYITGHRTFTGAPHINVQTLREKGFADENIEALEKALVGVMRIDYAFNKFSLGEDFCCNVLKFDPKQLVDPNFNMLLALGFSQEQIEEANDYICGYRTIEGAPYVNEEHYPIFDCANKCGDYGQRYLPYESHIKMMAAVQPFLSGAISKCITGESLLTTDRGMIRIGSLRNNEKPDNFSPLSMRVPSHDSKTTNTNFFYYGGFKPVKRIKLKNGHEVTGTFNHPLYCISDDGKLEWKMLQDITKGDYVALKLGSDIWSKTSYVFNYQIKEPYGCQKTITIPIEMTDDLAWLLGLYASEGCAIESTYSVSITHSDTRVLDKANSIFSEIFDVIGRISQSGGRCPSLIINSKHLYEFFIYLGIGKTSYIKTIPDCILQSLKNHVVNFMNGLFSDGYVIKNQAKIGICLSSKQIIDDLRYVLDNMGILSNTIEKYNKDYDRNYYELYVSGREAILLSNIILFNEDYRQILLDDMKNRSVGNSSSDIIPNVSRQYLFSLVPKDLRSKYYILNDPRTKHVSRQTILNMVDDGIDIPEDIANIIEHNIRFSKVEISESQGMREVFDISVPKSHSFIANGIVNHNTINMNSEATIQDVADCYQLAYDSGLKSVALYRDGCKLSQPLNTKSTDIFSEILDAVDLMDELSDAQASPEEIHKAQRRRLPSQRFGVTHEFKIGSLPEEGEIDLRHKVFLRTGEYPDGHLGEIFIDYANEDSFARTVLGLAARITSVSLQYGVPLEEFCDIFMSINQEPSGSVEHDNVVQGKSIFDVIGRILAYKYLGVEDVIHYTDEQVAKRNGSANKNPAVKQAPKEKSASVKLVKPSMKQCERCFSHRTAEISSCTTQCMDCHHVWGSCSS